MPIFCFDVNFAYDEKLVPITHHNGASIVPDATVMTLELVMASPENGVLWVSPFFPHADNPRSPIFIVQRGGAL